MQYTPGLQTPLYISHICINIYKDNLSLIHMDLLRYVIVGIGSILLGIIIAILARSIFAGVGVMVLTFLGYFLITLVDMVKPKETPVETTPKQDN